MKKRFMPQAKIIDPSVATSSSGTAATPRPLHYKLLPTHTVRRHLRVPFRISTGKSTMYPTAAFERPIISLSQKAGSGLKFLVIGGCPITNLRRCAKSASLRKY